MARPPVTPEQIAAGLRERIRDGEFRAGELLVQEGLAREFGVSRIPVREALRLLAQEGMVTMIRGQGASVVELRAAEVEELYAMRLALEPNLAPAIVENASARDIQRLQAYVSEMEANTHDREQWSRLNYEFHIETYRISGREHTARILTQLLNLVEPYSRLYVHGMHAELLVRREHRVMTTAIEEMDADALRVAIHEHIAGARDGLLRGMAAGYTDERGSAGTGDSAPEGVLSR